MNHFVASIANRLSMGDLSKSDEFKKRLIESSLDKCYGVTRQGLMPSDSSWWSSKEHIVFLRVFSIILSLDNPNSDATILRAASMCPGPWSVSSLKTLQRSKHDNFQLVASCIEIICRWSGKYHSHCIDLSDRVHATIASNKNDILKWIPKSIRIAMITRILKTNELNSEYYS